MPHKTEHHIGFRKGYTWWHAFAEDDADVLRDGDNQFIVTKIGGIFVCRLAYTFFTEYHDGQLKLYATPDQLIGELYRPIHSSMTYDDVNGATYAWDDGTHWHFAHCSPSQQLAFAEQVRDFAIARFVLPISRAQNKVVEAIGTTTRAEKQRIVKDYQDFAEDVGERAYQLVLAGKLGEFHRDSVDHRRILTIKAINEELAHLKVEGLTNVNLASRRTNVLVTASAVASRLAKSHIFKTYAQARAEAKKAAEAAAAQDTTPPDDHDHE